MRLSHWIAASIAAATLGCGGGAADKPKLVSVTGRVVTESGSPVAEAWIEFMPAKGAPSAATTDANGQFVLSYADGSQGAIAGSHQVRITVGSSAMGNGGDSKPAGPAKPPVLYILPQVTVGTDSNRLELKLPPKGQVG